MESNRKRKGFAKAKLVMSFYRAIKPASSTSSVQYTSSKPFSSSSASVGFIVNQDYVTPQPMQKVSFVIPAEKGQGRDLYDNPYYGVAADESVDLKATAYISCVLERFRLERVNSERRKYQDMH